MFLFFEKGTLPAKSIASSDKEKHKVIFLTFFCILGIINMEELKCRIHAFCTERTSYEKNRNDRRRYSRTCHTEYCLMPALRSEGYEISYIGSYEGIEKG